ncbi:uncharacterized protein si:ch211-217g15.3 [Megalops cyprinoides]|uniref:uncharacterized protein si:ch211-217g15.3 n=1 Tax=Megalops cyprinoides TaxID=118141 RepID=UPI001864296A|nr:uncharacterized protein si:ch211-217g15.3 [Megalops cyprinoides]
MFRIPLLISVSLILHGITATPYSRDKAGDSQYQETIKAEEFNGKMALGMKEVEPPEDMATTDDDIDPDMVIWKAMRASRGQKYAVAEEDRDELYHPSMVHMAEAHEQLAPEPDEEEGVLGNSPMARLYQRAEPDMDDVFHGFPGAGGLEDPPHVQEPEEDKDDLYHGYMPEHNLQQQPQPKQEQSVHRVYTQPEEDRDHLYHN